MAEIVYILSNPSIQKKLKIGKADREDVSIRMRELWTTSVPTPFDCVYACTVEGNEAVEKLMHKKFAKHRTLPNREFFKISAESAVKALKQYEIKDVTPGFREDFDSPLIEEEKAARWEERHELEEHDPSVAEAKDLHKTIKK